jgi:hypothetical protein
MPVRAIPLLALVLLAQVDYAREAIALGKTHDDALYESFNKGYSLSPADTIDNAEIVTEFRRAVMLVREKVAMGDYAITERDLNTAIAPYLGKVTYIVQARLNPMNTFIKPPAYDLYVSTGPTSKPIAPENLKREPVYAIGPPGSAIVAVRLEATFKRADILSARVPMLVVINDHADIVWQTRIDLSRFR